jgi:hypothetical protein
MDGAISVRYSQMKSKPESAHQGGTVGISLASGTCVSACRMHDAYNDGMWLPDSLLLTLSLWRWSYTVILRPPRRQQSEKVT